jgi:hypothetical protein
MSVVCAKIILLSSTKEFALNEFYTQETMAQIWNEELEAENFYNALIDAYDPYLDFDDDYEYEDEEPQDPYEGREDIAMEAGLFGWDS